VRVLPRTRLTRFALAVLTVAGLATLAVFLSCPGEARYLGRPTSGWAARLLRGIHFPDGAVCDLVVSRDAAGWVQTGFWWGTWRSVTNHLLIRDPGVAGEVTQRLIGGDPAAVPVLLQLLGRPEPVVRRAAALGLARVGERHPDALPALLTLVEDTDKVVRAIARDSVKQDDNDEARVAGVAGQAP
jgi:hypothetical protein